MASDYTVLNHFGNGLEFADFIDTVGHRRRIKTEEKAKVVSFVWGDEFIQFLTALAVLPRTILKNRMNSFFTLKSSWCNSKSFYAKNLARQGIE